MVTIPRWLPIQFYMRLTSASIYDTAAFWACIFYIILYNNYTSIGTNIRQYHSINFYAYYDNMALPWAIKYIDPSIYFNQV